MPFAQAPGLPVLAALVLAVTLSMTIATPSVSAQTYSAMNCDQLWHAYNAIFAAKGH